MIKIGVLSDTHNMLRPQVTAQLSQCKMILHAGDICRTEILEKLKTIAPVRAVRGNNDKEWAKTIPYIDTFDCYGIQILMCHKKKEIPKILSGINLVIYGHSHQYEDRELNGIRFLNPGSSGPRRFNQEVTMAILEIDKNHTYRINRIVFSDIQSKKIDIPDANQDRAKIISAVIKDIDKGIPSDKIAKKNHISLAFTEEISRMYLTHPGINLDGILNRLQ